MDRGLILLIIIIITIISASIYPSYGYYCHYPRVSIHSSNGYPRQLLSPIASLSSLSSYLSSSIDSSSRLSVQSSIRLWGRPRLSRSIDDTDKHNCISDINVDNFGSLNTRSKDDTINKRKKQKIGKSVGTNINSADTNNNNDHTNMSNGNDHRHNVNRKALKSSKLIRYEFLFDVSDRYRRSGRILEEDYTKYPLLSHQEEILLFRFYRFQQSLSMQQVRTQRIIGRNMTISEMARLLNTTTSHLQHVKRLGQAAFHKIELCNIRLVLRYCSRYAEVPNVDYEKVVLVGTTGLQKAIRKFDPDKGYRFSTYAVHCIRGATRLYVSDRTRSAGVSRRTQEILQAIFNAQEEFSALNGRFATNKDLALMIGIPEARVEDALQCHQHAIQEVTAAGGKASPKSPGKSRVRSFSLNGDEDDIEEMGDAELARLTNQDVDSNGNDEFDPVNIERAYHQALTDELDTSRMKHTRRFDSRDDDIQNGFDIDPHRTDDYDSSSRHYGPRGGYGGTSYGRAGNDPRDPMSGVIDMDRYQALHETSWTNSLYDRLQRHQIREMLLKSSDILSEREYFIMLRRLGLERSLNIDDCSLAYIGELLDLSSERVRLYEISALEKLRHGSFGERLSEALGDRVNDKMNLRDWKRQLVHLLTDVVPFKSSRTWNEMD